MNNSKLQQYADLLRQAESSRRAVAPLTVMDETLTVDDAYGHTTVRLYDGEEGATGPRGPQGVQGIPGEKGDTGEKGDAGYTPVKGTDYFTEADKAELVSRVTAALSSEQWTFELEDGSTITRNVVIQ